MQPQRITPRLFLPRNRLRQILIVAIDIPPRIRRLGKILRTLEQAPHKRFDQPSHRGSDCLEAFAHRPTDFAEGALDLVAGGVAVGAGGGENGACGVSGRVERRGEGEKGDT